MNNEEKIYHKIKEAAHKDSESSFPGMEKIWNRVEEKLETKTLKKHNQNWKKLAVAASVFLIGMLIYQFSKNEVAEISIPQENTVTNSEKDIQTTIEKSTEEPTVIKKDAAKIIKQQIIIQNTIVLQDTIKKNENLNAFPLAVNEKEMIKEAPMGYLPNLRNSAFNSVSSEGTDYLANRKIYEAVSVNSNYKIVPKTELAEEISSETKNDDLVIIDGKPSKKTKDEVNFDNYEIKLELKNPLYIINDEEYSEESLFGEKPTSKYAPLNKQKIKEIKVIEPEEAKTTYGEKGSNGVVIITIKK